MLLIMPISIKGEINDSKLEREYIGDIYAIFEMSNGEYYLYLQDLFIMNGKTAYCIEPNVHITTSIYNSTSNFDELNLPNEIKEKIKLFAYYGYDYYGDYPDLDKLEHECVVIPNDALYVGLIPTLTMYLSRMIDTDISRRLLTISTRAMNILTARDEDTHKSIKDVIKDLYDGRLSSILADDILSEQAIQSLPFAGGTNSQRAITELIESEQYDKAALMNELGLQANYNMKRESINSNEAQLAQDAILPFADDMLKQRQIACELVNEKFGLDWSVDFSSAWKIKREEIKTSLEIQKKSSQSTGNDKEDEVVKTEENDENNDK